MSTQQEAKKPGSFARMSRYVKDLRGELKKVVWPSKKQVINNTLVVIGVVIVASAVVSSFDVVLMWLMDTLVSLLGASA